MEKQTGFALGILILILVINFGSAFNGVVDFGENGIELRNVAGAIHYSNSEYGSGNSYCYGYFGSSGSNNDACACDENRDNKVTCCDSINSDGIWVKNLDGRSFNSGSYSISCSIPCVSVNGEWSITSEGGWSVCSNGQKTRTLSQTCNNPTPNSCGSNCVTTYGWTRNANIQTKIETVACTSDCVPTTEICDGLDNDCDGSVDEGIANITSGTDVGVCQSEIQQCIGGSFQVVQNRLNATVEICDNGLDDDCDGYVDNSDDDCSNPVCTNGDVTNYTLVNNYCNSNEVWNNYSFNLCQYNSWILNFNQTFNSTCQYGCYNGQCNSQPNSTLDVIINYPVNGAIFVSNNSPYEISLNVSSNQPVANWSINGMNYFDSVSFFDFDTRQNISFGINSFVACGNNLNGTDCDSVFVVLRNDLNQTNTSLFIDIISPINKVYDTNNILFNISSNGIGVWYVLNGLSVIYNESKFLDLEEGDYNLIAYAIDNLGNVVMDSVNFSVDFGDNGDNDCDEGCRNCGDNEQDEFNSIFMDEESGSIYLVSNNTENLVLDNSKKDFVFRDFILLFLLLILILGILILAVLVVRFLKNN